MDAVRSDFLSHDFFCKVREEGLVYTNCISQAPHTSTSHASILTGLYPFNHGVRWLVDYRVKGKLLQEILKDNDFRTAAFVGGFPLANGDLDRGFDLFDYREVVNDTKEGRERFMPANIVVQGAINWLEDNRCKNNFVFLHFFDAHLMLRSEFGKSPWPAKDDTGLFINIEEHLGRRRRRYQEECDFIGNQLGVLVNLSDIDLLIITADHGTKMEGEKDYPWVYNSKGEKVGTQFHVAELYEQQLKVPLFFWGAEVESRLVTEQVRSVDISPTILDMLNIDCPAVDGQSLLKENYPEYAYSETYFAQLVKANTRAYELYNNNEWGWSDIDSLVSIRTNRYKLICTANGQIKPYRFYDLEADPLEEDDLIDKPCLIDKKKALENYLLHLIENDKQMELHSKILDAKVKKRLKTLGYL